MREKRERGNKMERFGKARNRSRQVRDTMRYNREGERERERRTGGERETDGAIGDRTSPELTLERGWNSSPCILMTANHIPDTMTLFKPPHHRYTPLPFTPNYTQYLTHSI